MLERIIKLTGVSVLKKEDKQRIKAGNGVCPQEGDRCLYGSFGGVPMLPCFAGVEEMRCINGVWVIV